MANAERGEDFQRIERPVTPDARLRLREEAESILEGIETHDTFDYLANPTLRSIRLTIARGGEIAYMSSQSQTSFEKMLIRSRRERDADLAMLLPDIREDVTSTGQLWMHEKNVDPICFPSSRDTTPGNLSYSYATRIYTISRNISDKSSTPHPGTVS